MGLGRKSLSVLVLFLFFSPTSRAQLDDPGKPRLNGLSQDGQLLSVRIVRGEPIKIFVVGREEAKLDLSKLKLTVKRLSPSPELGLKVKQESNYFSLSENIQQPTDLEVTTQLKEKIETFKFKLDKN